MKSTNRSIRPFDYWLIGTSPLICHAWSEKARREMLAKQKKLPKAGRVTRSPEDDFAATLYPMGEGAPPTYGFPAMAIKRCIISAAHKDRGIVRSAAQQALWVDAQIIRILPAQAGAVCDLPLLGLWDADRKTEAMPQMREDMVRVGPQKTAQLAYRAQFTKWSIHLTGRADDMVLSEGTLEFLIDFAGAGIGIGDWRPERSGMFGTFARYEP